MFGEFLMSLDFDEVFITEFEKSNDLVKFSDPEGSQLIRMTDA